MTVLTRTEPGANIPAHHHTKAQETVFALEGDFVEVALDRADLARTSSMSR